MESKETITVRELIESRCYGTEIVREMCLLAYIAGHKEKHSKKIDEKFEKWFNEKLNTALTSEVNLEIEEDGE